jgi:hypothetical protein
MKPSVGAIGTEKDPAANHPYKAYQADAEIKETVAKTDIMMKRSDPASLMGCNIDPGDPAPSDLRLELFLFLEEH